MVSAWRLLVVFTSTFRVGGSTLFLLGSVGLAIEASYLKYARQVYYNDGAYEWGMLGWFLIEYGAYLIVLDGIVSVCYFVERSHDGLNRAWPFHSMGEYPLRNVIRDGALSVGFLLIGVGAGTIASAYPDATPYNNMHTWATFYHTRGENESLHSGAYMLLVGSLLLALSIPIIAIYCERLDVFYILPVYRCHQERRPPHPTEEVTCCFHVGRPPPVACVIQTGATATYQNNWFGAFFNHIYPAFILYFVASIFWVASLNGSTYSPFSSDTLCSPPTHTVYAASLPYVCDRQYQDPGYLLFVSTALFVTAATLFTIHTIVYYASILLNRPLIVDNFAVEQEENGIKRNIFTRPMR